MFLQELKMRLKIDLEERPNLSAHKEKKKNLQRGREGPGFFSSANTSGKTRSPRAGLNADPGVSLTNHPQVVVVKGLIISSVQAHQSH